MKCSEFARACLGAVLLLGVPVHAQDLESGAARVAIVWWPADPDGAATTTVETDVEACLSARIRAVAPELSLVPQRAVRDALYPLLEPATQPETEAEFGALLAREEVRARLAQHGLRYLVAFSGGTVQAAPGGFVLCGAGYGGGGCLGFGWQGETTTLDAALWMLDRGVSVQRPEGVKAEGASMLPALIFPVPIPARTLASACRELGSRIAVLIRKTEAARSPNR